MKITGALFTFLLFLVLAFVGHDYFDLVEISAVPSKKETKINQHYQSLYSKQKFITIDKKGLDLPALKKPIVIVNFWASWCTPCVEEFNDLNELVKKYKDDILIIGINTDEEDQLKKIKKMKKKHSLNFPIVADNNSELVDRYIVDSIPFSVIYLNGKLHLQTVGIQDFLSGEYIEAFDSAIPKKTTDKPQKKK